MFCPRDATIRELLHADRWDVSTLQHNLPDLALQTGLRVRVNFPFRLMLSARGERQVNTGRSVRVL